MCAEGEWLYKVYKDKDFEIYTEMWKNKPSKLSEKSEAMVSALGDYCQHVRECPVCRRGRYEERFYARHGRYPCVIIPIVKEAE